MKYDELKELWEKEETMSFRGWDFSYLENRWDDESLPWDYKDIIKKYLKFHYKLLDMGTGGGEFLLSLNHPYNNTTVTEGWAPNLQICKEKLEPLGITVKQVFNDNELPFTDNTFDIVINKHGSFNIKEVKRILKPNGIFITQQVGGKNNEMLSKYLIENFVPQYSKNTLENVLNIILKNSFQVIYSNEYFPYLRFKDIGAIVYFAKIISWEFPEFSVNKSFERLCTLYEKIKIQGYIESSEHRFIIVAKNI